MSIKPNIDCSKGQSSRKISADKDNLSPRLDALRPKSMKQLGSSKKNSGTLLQTLKLTADCSELLASLRMNTATTKARLSNERFKVVQIIARDKDAVASVVEEIIARITGLKDRVIGRLESQSSRFTKAIDDNVKKV